MAGPASYGKANLLLHHGGEVLSATSLNINRPLSSLRIPSGDFPSGITAITLFDEQNRPLCERLVFLRRPDTLQDRKSVVSGKSVSVRVDLGGRRLMNKKKNKK